MSRLIVALYFVETGVLLIVAPWTSWWQRNYFADVLPVVRTFLASDAAVVLVVAAGVLTTVVGVGELHGLFFRRLRNRIAPPQSTRDA